MQRGYLGEHGLAEIALVASWSWLLRFGITGHGSNAEQSCGEEVWLDVIPVEQLTVKEFVSTFPIKNFSNFSYHSWHFPLAKLVWYCRRGWCLGSLFSCSCLLSEALVLVCTRVSQLEDTNTGDIPEGDKANPKAAAQNGVCWTLVQS